MVVSADFGDLCSLVKLRIISTPLRSAVPFVCSILQQTQLPWLREFELELRPPTNKQRELYSFGVGPDAFKAGRDWTVPPALAGQLDSSRVMLWDVKDVHHVGYLRNLFRHTKPGVLEIVAAPGVMLHED
jgi:hypothetical protein